MKLSNRRIYFGIMTASMLDSFAVGILMPIIPFIALQMGANAFAVGALISVQFIFGALGSPILGRISDRIPRGVMLLISMCSICICYWLMIITTSLAVLFLLRGLIGFMSSNLVILESMIAEISSHEDRAAGMARLRLGSTVGLILGPAIVAFLGTFTVLDGWLPMMTLAAIMTTLVPMVIIFTLRGQLTRLNKKDEEKKPYIDVVKIFKTEPQVRDFALIKALVAMCFALMMAIAPVWTEVALQWTSVELSNLVMAFGLSLFVIQILIATKSIAWLTSGSALLLACVILIPAFASVVIFPGEKTLLICCVVLGLSSAVVNITVPVTISRMTYANVGAVLGLVATIVLVGGTLGPMFFGFIYETFGNEYAWLCGLVCAIYATWLSYKHFSKAKSVDAVRAMQ